MLSSVAVEDSEVDSETNSIRLRGVRVHNLQNVDLDIPLNRLTVIVGVSGSGKSSLAFDTLYAEGQRRYIESFSAYARQFLDRLQRPDADLIENIPPAIAIRQGAGLRGNQKGNQSTVGTVTEIQHYLRLLFARLGTLLCPSCGDEVRSSDTSDVIEAVRNLADGARFQIAFPCLPLPDESVAEQLSRLRENGFTRLMGRLSADDALTTIRDDIPASIDYAIIDRLVAGKSDEERMADSIELAFREGEGRCFLFVPPDNDRPAISMDERDWSLLPFHRQSVCAKCDRTFDDMDPRLFNENSALGACPQCEGQGNVPAIEFARVVPDSTKTIRDGAIAPWTTPAYEHELHELLDLASDYDVPVDVPFSELTDAQRQVIMDGVSERDFGGLRGFFAWLHRNRYKVGVGVFLSRWRSWQTCSLCNGSRLNETARAVRVGSFSLPNFCESSLADALQNLSQLRSEFADSIKPVVDALLLEIISRLEFLVNVGLGYLSLNRRMKTLAGGESGRVALTAALGSNLVNTLYVLDEPTAGLHPADTDKVMDAIVRLRNTGNTVVVVEHDPRFLSIADHVVEIGPAAGREGGTVTFAGPPAELSAADSTTGNWLREVEQTRESSAKTSGATEENSGERNERQLRLTGASLHNLQNVSVEIPLNQLVVVTGVSGSGKSSLVEKTLYPAVCSGFGNPASIEQQGAFATLEGADQLAGIVLVTQSPVGRTARSNPATYLKVFDDIRKVFAETTEAKLRNFTPGTFSFNSAKGGRCPHCEGAGRVSIDMQFLADISMTCSECQGQRYRPEVLEAKYRNRSISDVLNMSADEAFAFFRGRKKIQAKLQCLRDVGLGYVPVGQPASTLSGGESQRLKLAAMLGGITNADATGPNKNGGTLFVLDEPTTGLHGRDVENLLRCFHTLISIGHSLIVVEHNLSVIHAADHIIDLGPGAGQHGGTVVAHGSVAEIAVATNSVTGRILAAN